MMIQPLASYGNLGNTFPVAAKSVTGRGNPFCHKAHDASLLMLVFYCVNSAHPNYGGLDEAASAGRDLVSGISTLVQFTTSRAWKLLGGDLDHHKEAIMPNTISLKQVASSLRVENDQAYVTSNELAKVFGKTHNNVIRDIEDLGCSPEFSLLNFEQSSYRAGNGQTYKNYHITRDGFAFLAMGFTGKKAAQFKEAYIQAFNQMEKQLSGNSGQLPAPDPIDSLDFIHQRWLVVVENGEVMGRRLLNTDEYLFNRKQFINFFKEPNIGFNQVDQLMELSKAVNERLVKLVQAEAK
jgi:Rha family phage regulatory protein